VFTALLLAGCSPSRSGTDDLASPPLEMSSSAPSSALPSTARVPPELLLMSSCPVTTDAVSRLLGHKVASSVSASSVAKELVGAPKVYLQDFYAAEGLAAARIASPGGQSSVRDTCAWQTGSDAAPGVQINVVVVGEPLAGSLADSDDLAQETGAKPLAAPGFTSTVHEVTALDRTFFHIYTVVGSGSSAISIDVDLIDPTNSVSSVSLQTPGREIFKAAMASLHH
jgi:hypothetical protein